MRFENEQAFNHWQEARKVRQGCQKLRGTLSDTGNSEKSVKALSSEHNTLSFNVPLPPSVNHMYTTAKGTTQVFLTKAGRAYKKHVVKEAQDEALAQRWKYGPGQKLSLTLGLYFPNNRRSDASNRIKIVEDSIAAALGFDDKIIDVLHVERKGIDPTNPRCEVSLSVIEG